MTKSELTAAAHALPLLDLARQVVHGSYTPGVEDVALLERLGDSAVSGQVTPLLVAFDNGRHYED